MNSLKFSVSESLLSWGRQPSPSSRRETAPRVDLPRPLVGGPGLVGFYADLPSLNGPQVEQEKGTP